MNASRQKPDISCVLVLKCFIGVSGLNIILFTHAVFKHALFYFQISEEMILPGRRSIRFSNHAFRRRYLFKKLVTLKPISFLRFDPKNVTVGFCVLTTFVFWDSLQEEKVNFALLLRQMG